MSINLNTLVISGAILFWIGVIVCVVSIILFIAVSTGISDEMFSKYGSLDETTSILTFHHSDTILIGWKDRLVFLLPLAAGITLVVSGVQIRGKVSEFQKVFEATNSHFGSTDGGLNTIAEQQGGAGQTEAKSEGNEKPKPESEGRSR